VSGGFYRRVRGGSGAFSRLGVGLVLVTAAACQTVAVTGRQQFNMFTLEQDKELGAQAYSEVLGMAKLADSGPNYAMVRRVVARLSKAADDPGFAWEAHVIDDPATVNAWCMPGGKIAVYTGILPVTADETGLAVVLGHEIAHAVARHGTERMSTQSSAQLVIGLAASQWKDLAQYEELLGVAANMFVFLPWGREHELEADRIGLVYMARAGYDPRQAIDFWKRMAAQSAGKAPPEFLSTHPSDEHRIAELEQQMPAAIELYERSRGQP